MDHLIDGGALPEVLFSGVLILPKQACKLKVQKHWNTDHEWEKTGGEVSDRVGMIQTLEDLWGNREVGQMEGRGLQREQRSRLRALLQAGRHKAEEGSWQLSASILRPRH